MKNIAFDSIKKIHIFENKSLWKSCKIAFSYATLAKYHPGAVQCFKNWAMQKLRGNTQNDPFFTFRGWFSWKMGEILKKTGGKIAPSAPPALRPLSSYKDWAKIMDFFIFTTPISFGSVLKLRNRFFNIRFTVASESDQWFSCPHFTSVQKWDRYFHQTWYLYQTWYFWYHKTLKGIFWKFNKNI